MHVLISTGLTLPQVSDADLARITAAAGPDPTVTLATTAEEALAAAPNADVILGPISEEVFAAAEKLRWVAAIASGVDHYLFPAFRDSNVVLTSEKGLVGSHLAEHAFALLFALTRGIAQNVRYGNDTWEHRMEFRRDNIELEGLTMGIIGLGGTGRAIARRAAAFGMLCQAIDREEVTTTPEVAEVLPTSAFNELLETSDVVAVCCPLTEETQDLFDDDAFAHMKSTAYLVNVTRGGIVDGDALIRALEGGRIAGAGLDVTPEEPLPPDHALWDAPNLVMTPHTAGASQLRAGRNLDRFCRNLESFATGEPLEGVVNKELGF